MSFPEEKKMPKKPKSANRPIKTELPAKKPEYGALVKTLSLLLQNCSKHPSFQLKKNWNSKLPATVTFAKPFSQNCITFMILCVRSVAISIMQNVFKLQI